MYPPNTVILVIADALAIEEPPFEVTETGWGEFEIQIKIFFQPEASEKPLTLFHFLHLHPYGPNKDEEKEQGTTIEAHQYDEVVRLTTINFESHLWLSTDCRYLEILRKHSLRR
jgi:transcription initiation factor IIF auxiliary subunit